MLQAQRAAAALALDPVYGSDPLSPPLLPGPRPVAADGIEVLQILKTLWRRRLVIALVTLALTVIGYWFINRITPRYAAETVLLLDVSAADSTNEVDEIVNGLSKDEALINSQIDIMSSRNIAERVVDSLRLTSYPEFQTVMARLYQRRSISDHIWPTCHSRFADCLTRRRRSRHRRRKTSGP